MSLRSYQIEVGMHTPNFIIMDFPEEVSKDCSGWKFLFPIWSPLTGWEEWLCYHKAIVKTMTLLVLL